MTKIGTLDLNKAAAEAAGNWKKFECFCWFRDSEIEDADNWAIFYTHHRDSGLLDLSNASVIRQKLEAFSEQDDPDVVFESHNHWAVGHVDGFSMRVFKDGQITEAFKVYHDLCEQMDDYPILDEEDYSQRECDATYENVQQAIRYLKHNYILPEDAADEVCYWLGNHTNALENVDDQGGWPDDDELIEAFEALGYKQEEEDVL